jgi:hypothetical protein
MEHEINERQRTFVCRNLNALTQMKDRLLHLYDDVDRYESELKSGTDDYYSYGQSAARSAIKRGVIDLKYRLTMLVKELYK